MVSEKRKEHRFGLGEPRGHGVAHGEEEQEVGDLLALRPARAEAPRQKRPVEVHVGDLPKVPRDPLARC